MVSITTATDEDVLAILEMTYELGRPRPQTDSGIDVFSKLVYRYIHDSDKHILVAKTGQGKIVGMASIILLSRLNYKYPELYIPELVVFEKHQSRGIGRMLVESCITFAKKHKCFRIRLESANKRKSSHQFYIHLGFEQHSLSFAMTIK